MSRFSSDASAIGFLIDKVREIHARVAELEAREARRLSTVEDLSALTANLGQHVVIGNLMVPGTEGHKP